MITFSKSRIQIHPIAAFVLCFLLVSLGMSLSQHMKCSSEEIQPKKKHEMFTALFDPAHGTQGVPTPSLRQLPEAMSNGPSALSVASLCHEALHSRHDLATYMNGLGLVGEGVEIGVRGGHFSVWTLQNWHGKKLYLVDPWEKQDTSVYQDRSNAKQSDQEVWMM